MPQALLFGAVSRQLLLPGYVRGLSQSYRSRLSGEAFLYGLIRRRTSTATTKVGHVLAIAKRSEDGQEPQPLPTHTKHVARPEQKIRDAVRAAIYGMLHQNEELKTVNALAKMNGYQPVRIDEKQSRVTLAEGVIADAHKKVNEEFTLFSRPASGASRESTTEKGHPPFLEENFTLYRIMEKSVEDRFNQWENRVQEWYQGKVDAAKRVVDRVCAPVSKLIARNRRTSGDANVENDRDAQAGAIDDDTKYLTTAAGSNEDILVLSKQDGRSLLVEDVPPRYRLLIMPGTSSFRPYTLRHGRSGTVIYTGLVLFAAVPLTYRSFKYAVEYAEYPAIAKTMIVSLLASISYSLWASRDSARTRQSLVVSSAVSSRIVARDDATEVQLVDQACKTLADAVMHEYFSRFDGKDGSGKEYKRNLAETPTNAGLDPVGIAMKLGLLQRKNASDHDLVAVDFATVCSKLCPGS